jgi:hypothetical protein
MRYAGELRGALESPEWQAFMVDDVATKAALEAKLRAAVDA